MKAGQRHYINRALVKARPPRLPPGFTSMRAYCRWLKTKVKGWPVRSERMQPHLPIGSRVLIVQGDRQDTFCQQGLVSNVDGHTVTVKYKGRGRTTWSTTHKHFSAVLLMGSGVELRVGSDGCGSLQQVSTSAPFVDVSQVVPDDGDELD